METFICICYAFSWNTFALNTQHALPFEHTITLALICFFIRIYFLAFIDTSLSEIEIEERKKNYVLWEAVKKNVNSYEKQVKDFNKKKKLNTNLCANTYSAFSGCCF